MKRLLFVDHAFHRKTRSSDFFIEILREAFEVEIYYLDPDARLDLGLLDALWKADTVVLWQMDFLAPLVRGMGKPTIVIPMYDGSAGMPDLHWLFAAGARFCNFSFVLHERIRALGEKSKLLRYFPEPVDERKLPRFDRLKAFFWQRRPDHGITVEYVNALIGTELDEFHLHNVTDVPVPPRPPFEPNENYVFTESCWFEKKSDYEECLSRANVFVAPRIAEGIGLALLEAMASGMLVVAHDEPTNNEYVSNGLTGILFKLSSNHEPVSFRSTAQTMARTGWQSVVDGHRRWVESQPSIIAWIESAEPGPILSMDFAKFFGDLWSSYYASLAEYEGFLQRHLGLLFELSDAPMEAVLSRIGLVRNGQRGLGSDKDRLPNDGVFDLRSSNNRHIGEGWSHGEAEWRWSLGKRSVLHFSGLSAEAPAYEVKFRCSALPALGSVFCDMKLNGRKVFSGRLSSAWKTYSFLFDPAFLKDQNVLEMSFDRSQSSPSDRRDLAVCFSNFAIVKAKRPEGGFVLGGGGESRMAGGTLRRAATYMNKIMRGSQ